jgi:hypothetical protein
VRESSHFGRRRAVLALFAVAAAMAASANGARGAASVTYLLSIDDNGAGVYTPGDFAVYATDSTADGNGGLASFEVDLAGYATVVNQSPFIIYHVTDAEFFPYQNYDLEMGLTESRSPSNAAIGGAQNIMEFGLGFAAEVNGIGQRSGNVDHVSFPPFDTVSVVSFSPSTAFSAPVLLGTGTYSGGAPSWNDPGNNFVDLFTSDGQAATEEVTPGDGLILQTQEVPEPGVMGVLAGGAIGVLGRRRGA